MDPDPDILEAWKRQRSVARVPEGFSDRVMAELEARPAVPRRARWLHLRWGAAIAKSLTVRIWIFAQSEALSKRIDQLSGIACSRKPRK